MYYISKLNDLFFLPRVNGSFPCHLPVVYLLLTGLELCFPILTYDKITRIASVYERALRNIRRKCTAFFWNTQEKDAKS